MNEDEFNALSRKFLSALGGSFNEDFESLAVQAAQICQIFNARRELNTTIFRSASFDRLIEEAKKTVIRIPSSRLKLIDQLTRIFGSASFIHWKCLRDFEFDQREIFDKFVLPLIEIELVSAVDPPASNKLSRHPTVLYLPNVSPFSNGVANGVSANELIASYNSAYLEGKAESQLWVGSLAAGGRHELEVMPLGASFQADGLRGVYYRDYSALLRAIDLVRPDIILVDYFTYPWNVLPRLFPRTRFAYKSFGFNLFVTKNCTTIIGGRDDSSLHRLAAYAQEKLLSQEITLRVGHFPRLRVERGLAAKRPTVETEETKRAVRELSALKEVLIMGTLCRSTKISMDFISLVSELLRSESNVVFFAAGNGVGGLRSRFPPDVLNRVFLFNQIVSKDLLNLCDVYLETFPEHQGMSVVEALHTKAVVISLNNADARHVLLGERLAECVVSSRDEYLKLARRLVFDQSLRRRLRMLQAELLQRLFGDPADSWASVEQHLIAR